MENETTELLVEERCHDGAILEENVLRNCRICGYGKSDNGASYPRDVLHEACHLYEGHPVYLNHDLGVVKGKKRLYEDRIATLRNVRAAEEAFMCDMELNPHKPMAKAVAWDYMKNNRVGLSHIANGKVRAGTVEKINEVYSVDLVNEPATNRTLREEVVKEVPVAAPVDFAKEFAALKIVITGLESQVADLKSQTLVESKPEAKPRPERGKPESHVVLPITQEKLPQPVDLRSWVADLRRG